METTISRVTKVVRAILSKHMLRTQDWEAKVFLTVSVVEVPRQEWTPPKLALEVSWRSGIGSHTR